MTPPLLTIVVASAVADETFSRYLEHLSASHLSDATEIIALVNADTGDTQAALALRWPKVTWIVSQRSRLVPELWGLGVARAHGAIVVLTIPACLPSPDWAGRLLEAHDTPHAAVGGAIELALSASVVAAAVYFVRYTSYMLPFDPATVDEVPGDNGAYKREDIASQIEWIARRGFWETTINARLRGAGRSLWMDPSMTVVFHGHLGVGDFSRQRFRHGVVFGREKGARLRTVQRVAHVLAEPIVPMLMLSRIVRTLMRKRRHVGRFLTALPLVCWFLVCWASGEAAGLLSRPESGG